MAPLVPRRAGGRLMKLARRVMVFHLFLVPLSSLAAPDSRTLPEDHIKAGFLFNFTRFVEWGPNAFATPASSFVLCIVDDPGMADLLSVAASGKMVNDRGISIRRTRPADDLRSCNILFIRAGDDRHLSRILSGIRGISILTVGESPAFLAAGGMINFSVQENKVKLELNLDSATHSGLKVSAKLVAVSRLVPASPGGNEVR